MQKLFKNMEGPGEIDINNIPEVKGLEFEEDIEKNKDRDYLNNINNLSSSARKIEGEITDEQYLTKDERLSFVFISGHLDKIAKGEPALTYEMAAPVTAERLYVGAKLIHDNPALYELSIEQKRYINSIINKAKGTGLEEAA